MRTASAGLEIAIVMSIAVVELTSCKELFREPPSDCPEGFHASAGQCCGKGEEWVAARNRCLCLDPQQCGAAASTASAPPADAATATGSPVGGAPSTAEHPCVGRWTGMGHHSEGERGRIEVEVTPLEAGTVDSPFAKTCGEAKEHWRKEGPCLLRLVRCSVNREILIASGHPSENSGCEGLAQLVLQCDKSVAQYRRQGGGVSARAELQREAAADHPQTPR